MLEKIRSGWEKFDRQICGLGLVLMWSKFSLLRLSRKPAGGQMSRKQTSFIRTVVRKRLTRTGWMNDCEAAKCYNLLEADWSLRQCDWDAKHFLQFSQHSALLLSFLEIFRWCCQERGAKVSGCSTSLRKLCWRVFQPSQRMEPLKGEASVKCKADVWELQPSRLKVWGSCFPRNQRNQPRTTHLQKILSVQMCVNNYGEWHGLLGGVPSAVAPCCLHKELSIMEAQSPKSKQFVGWWWLIHPCRCWAEPKHCVYLFNIYIYRERERLFIKSIIKISSHIYIHTYTPIYMYIYIYTSNLKISKVLQISNSAHPFFICGFE